MRRKSPPSAMIIQVIDPLSETCSDSHRLPRARACSAEVGNENIASFCQKPISFLHTSGSVKILGIFYKIGIFYNVSVGGTLTRRPGIILILAGQKQAQHNVRVSKLKKNDLPCRKGIEADSASAKELATALVIAIPDSSGKKRGKSIRMLIFYFSVSCKRADHIALRIVFLIILLLPELFVNTKA